MSQKSRVFSRSPAAERFKSRSVSVTPSTRRTSAASSALVDPSSAGSSGGMDATLSALKSYGLPVATLALCGVGGFYLAKRMNDLESKVGASRRNDVRHLSETDVQLIVKQMHNDGSISIPQWNEEAELQKQQFQQALLENQRQQQQQLLQLQQAMQQQQMQMTQYQELFSSNFPSGPNVKHSGTNYQENSTSQLPTEAQAQNYFMQDAANSIQALGEIPVIDINSDPTTQGQGIVASEWKPSASSGQQ